MIAAAQAAPSKWRKHALPAASGIGIAAASLGYWQAETIRADFRAESAAIRAEIRETGARLEKRVDRMEERQWKDRAGDDAPGHLWQAAAR